MGLMTAISSPKRTLKRKLFVNMLLLAIMLLLTLLISLFLLGRFHSTKEDAFEVLDIQMDSFENAITTYFDHLAAAGVQLSNRMSAVIDDYLLENGLDINDLTDSSQHLTAVQEAMIEPLCQKLLRENCSGVFVMLDATVNSALEHSDLSRAGLYLQINGYDTAGDSVLLYRGPADLAKNNGMMPHRKWHLEFNVDRIPNYEQIMELSRLPADEAYFLTELFSLPGTSEQVMLLVVPMSGADGTFYGLCGIEVSASYFMSYHSMPERSPHLTCLLVPDADTLQPDAGLSCGIQGGYHLAPNGALTTKDPDGLRTFTGDSADYVGVTRSITLSPNNAPYTLALLIPKTDYDQSMRKTVLQNVLLWFLIMFFSVHCCLFFSRRFLSPILKDLEQIKSKEHAQSNIPEINDLFEFLSEKDREYEETLRLLTLEKQQVQTNYEKAQTEITRLSYKMKQEVDPEGYQFFRNGLQDLTPAERRIFDLYFDGKSAKEILELLQIKENTLKFHNKGIYSKLGVNSRKQLLQYAALLKQELSE